MLKQHLSSLKLAGDIQDDPETLERYSHDASLFEVRPELVVFPKTVDDIKKVVALVAELKKSGEKVSVTARSAGTDMSGGPLNESIILDFTKYFNHVLEVSDS